MTESRITRRNALFASTSAAALWGQSEKPNKKKTILFIGGHLDDSEWGAAGLMFRALRDGLRVVVIQTVSDWSNWPPTQGREAEVRQGILGVARKMGVEKILLDYKYHHVPVDLELKRRIAQIHADIGTDIAVVQHESDYWTDHANTARAGRDAVMFAHGYLGRDIRRPDTILAYPVAPYQTIEFQPDTFVDTTDVVDRIAWLHNELESVVTKGPRYVASLTLNGPAAQGYPKKMDLTNHADEVLAQERNWGAMCGVRFAEAFRSIRYHPREIW